MKLAISSLVFGAGILAACSSVPTQPGRSYIAAQEAVGNAEKLPVSQYGAPELSVARQRLEASRQASLQGKSDLAEMLATESLVSSELAMAKTTLGQTEQTNQSMQRNQKGTP